MTAENFCYWLNGYFEIAWAEKGETKKLNEGQIEMIEQHLALVFKKVTQNLASPEEVEKRKQEYKLRDQLQKLEETNKEIVDKYDTRTKPFVQPYHPFYDPSTTVTC